MRYPASEKLEIIRLIEHSLLPVHPLEKMGSLGLATEGQNLPSPAVLSFVREWRTQHDSNVRPLPSEGNALSS
jgi:hypothetical protein